MDVRGTSITISTCIYLEILGSISQSPLHQTTDNVFNMHQWLSATTSLRLSPDPHQSVTVGLQEPRFGTGNFYYIAYS